MMIHFGVLRVFRLRIISVVCCVSCEGGNSPFPKGCTSSQGQWVSLVSCSK